MNIFKKVQLFFSTLWDTILCRKALTHRSAGVKSRVDGNETRQEKHVHSVKEEDFVDVSLDVDSLHDQRSTAEAAEYNKSRRPGKLECIDYEWIQSHGAAVLPETSKYEEEHPKASVMMKEQQEFIDHSTLPIEQSNEASLLAEETGRNSEIVNVDKRRTVDVLAEDIYEGYGSAIDPSNRHMYGYHVTVQDYNPNLQEEMGKRDCDYCTDEKEFEIATTEIESDDRTNLSKNSNDGDCDNKQDVFETNHNFQERNDLLEETYIDHTQKASKPKGVDGCNNLPIDREGNNATGNLQVEDEKRSTVKPDSVIKLSEDTCLVQTTALVQLESSAISPLLVAERDINLPDTVESVNNKETTVDYVSDQRDKIGFTSNDSEETARIRDNNPVEEEFARGQLIEASGIDHSTHSPIFGVDSHENGRQDEIDNSNVENDENVVLCRNEVNFIRAELFNSSDDQQWFFGGHNLSDVEKLSMAIFSEGPSSSYLNDRSCGPNKMTLKETLPGRDDINQATTSFCEFKGECSKFPQCLPSSNNTTNYVFKSDSLSNFLPAKSSENAGFDISSSDSGNVDECSSLSRMSALQEMMCTSKGILKLSPSFENVDDESKTSLDDLESSEFKNVDDSSREDISNSVVSSRITLDIPIQSSLEGDSNSSNVDLITGWAFSFEGPLKSSTILNDDSNCRLFRAMSESDGKFDSYVSHDIEKSSSSNAHLPEIVVENESTLGVHCTDLVYSEKAGDCDYSKTEKFMNDVNAALNESLMGEGGPSSRPVTPFGDGYFTDNSNQNDEDWLHSVLVESIKYPNYTGSSALDDDYSKLRITDSQSDQLCEMEKAHTSGVIQDLRPIVEEVVMKSLKERQCEDSSCGAGKKYDQGISPVFANDEDSSSTNGNSSRATSEPNKSGPSQPETNQPSHSRQQSICGGVKSEETISECEANSQIRLIEKPPTEIPSNVSDDSREKWEKYEGTNKSETILVPEDNDGNRFSGPTGDGASQVEMPDEETGSSNTSRRKRNRRRKKKSN